jgi:DNA recombination protein RmuC
MFKTIIDHELFQPIVIATLLCAKIILFLLWFLSTERLKQKNSSLEEKELQIQSLQSALQTAQDQNSNYQTKLATLQANHDSSQQHYQDRLQWVEKTQDQIQETFQILSQKSLQEASQNFLNLAEGRFKIIHEDHSKTFDSKQRQVGDLLDPIKIALNSLEEERKRDKNQWHQTYGNLEEMLKKQAEAVGLVQFEARALNHALKAPQVRGLWGELQLKRVVELAGMTAYCDFEAQSTVYEQTEIGLKIKRPDLIVRLPEGKSIAIDAKVPLKAYLEALDSSQIDMQKIKLREHADQLKKHVIALSQKSYWTELKGLDMVVLFIPADTFLHHALEVYPDLIEWAALKQVLIATPTSLIALLKTCAYGWQQEKLESQLTLILSGAKELHTRLKNLYDHLEELKKGLERSVTGFNKLIGSWHTRVLPSAQKLLEIDPGQATFDQCEPIETPIKAMPDQLS